MTIFTNRVQRRLFEAWCTEVSRIQSGPIWATDLDEAISRARSIFLKWHITGNITVMAADASESWTGPIQ